MQRKAQKVIQNEKKSNGGQKKCKEVLAILGQDRYAQRVDGSSVLTWGKMGIPQGHFKTGMPKKLTHHLQRNAPLYQPGGKRMPQGMEADL